MNREMLDRLRCFGFAPRTMLDIGANVGQFAHAFLKVFPDCAPVLVEPNPHCHQDLARLPYERHAFAAAESAGHANLFLSKAWLQTTGASLFREQSHHFRDEVVTTQSIQTKRIDDVFAGRRFDFVKIDTQGAEMAVLTGGEAVIRQADYILIELSLIEFNKGGARAEDVIAKLGSMGFRCAEIAEFHRLQGVDEGRLIQLDMLFERNVRRPSQGFAYTPLHDHERLLRVLAGERAKCPDFRVIDVGAAANPWSRDVIDATFDMNECAAAPVHFRGNLNDPRSWDPVLAHVAAHGRFNFAICAHTLEDLAYPAVTLEMLPRIADAGFVSVPSRYLESLRPEGPYRGFIHHRWILDQDEKSGRLILAPKIPMLEHLAVPQEQDWAAAQNRFELQMMWRGAIAFSALNGDYLGPTRKHVVDMYGEFMGKA
jgi:FkbM family methyltransferase